MDPRSLRIGYRRRGAVDVTGMSPREPGDDGTVDLAGDRLDRLEVAGRGGGEAGLDDVHAEA